MMPVVDLLAAVPVGQAYLTARESRWVLRRCARRGHVVAYLADPGLAPLTGPLPLPADTGSLLRCLRCGTWVEPSSVGVAERLGTAQSPTTVDEVPLPVRGGHGRRFGLLKLVALERLLKGLALISASLVAYHVASDRASILAYVERLLVAFRPLGTELGVHLTGSVLVTRVEGWLSGSGDPVRLAGLGLLAYGLVQIVEGVGLWGGWRWAEYLAAVATSAFIPLEVYEIVADPTPLKIVFLVLNVLVVGYLVYKGRLFGVRGGHTAYLREVRDSTLPADLLRSIGRSPAELTSHRII
jgi:uncharacterized membrane protein (DUF2068 family)